MAFWKDDTGTTLRKERRQPMPFIKKTKITLGILTWVCLFLTYLIIDSTYPSNFMVPLIDDMYGKTVTFIPHPFYSKIAFSTCILALLLSIANIVIMLKYNKRKSDRVSPAIVLSLVISIIACIYFAIYLI